MRWSLRGSLLAAAALMLGLPAVASGLDVDVTAAPYSAAGDGVTNDRPAIQRAIDAVSAAGGGKVTLPAPKTYLTGNLLLKSNVELNIASGATVKQSQVVAHYANRPILGSIIDETIPWNFTFYRNHPLIYGGSVRNVKVTGSGTIELTQTADANLAIRNDAVGMWDVSGFEISGIHAIGGTTPYIGLYFNANGVVRDTTLNQPAGGAVSGVEVVSSQHIVVERNVMRNPDGSPGATDDGIALSTTYGDPRATGWWRSNVPRPLLDIVIRDNVVEARCCSALAFIPWGTSAPDKRDVEFRDIRIENNVLNAPTDWDSVKCWCDDPWNGSAGPAYTSAEDDQSPMTNVTFSGNRYSGDVSRFLKARISGIQGAPFHPGNPYLKNGGFEDTGIAYWSKSGTDRQVGAESYVAGQTGRWFGFITNFADGYTALAQGVGLPASTRYTFRAKIQTSGDPVRMYVHNQCTGATVAAKWVSGTGWSTEDLSFTTTTACSNYHVGIDSSGQTRGWGRIDDARLLGDVIVAGDARIGYSGVWQQWLDPADADGTHMLAVADRTTANVTFEGTRARWRTIVGPNAGLADVWLDGVFKGTVDMYRPGFSRTEVYDTGTLTRGTHVLGIRPTWTKNPLSAYTYVTIDAIDVSGW
ncbi:endopygalactorunase [Conexibacter sp. JD483]|uniref:endopygalactorunase n=1 Tax=unclassified Conexibacter TaxID=2627773 RepID=UPI0027259BD9|nr:MULTISPECIES: endopygalactorunase [unclassified Conexibacter]MDO8189510.1 endopygalactorunase [Conexibacter sp. CPCC 205706]MDO8202092.1 endopygalactorunase [Conexibacter sp. CPCC 205762]MDR9372818.1 endopygalactorunase [Conexibacter sp. JD483]